MNKSCRSKVNKEKLVLSNTLDQLYTEHSIKCSQIHILFKCTQNILQNRLCYVTKQINYVNKFKKLKSYLASLLTTTV